MRQVKKSIGHAGSLGAHQQNLCDMVRWDVHGRYIHPKAPDPGDDARQPRPQSPGASAAIYLGIGMEPAMRDMTSGHRQL
jgi:hypothetical protein